MAEGTLLMNWQESTEKSRVFLLIRAEKISCTRGMRAMLPEKIKKNTKVSNRP